MQVERATRVSILAAPWHAWRQAVPMNRRLHQKTDTAARAASAQPLPGNGSNPIPSTMIRTASTTASTMSRRKAL